MMFPAAAANKSTTGKEAGAESGAASVLSDRRSASDAADLEAQKTIRQSRARACAGNCIGCECFVRL